MFGREQTTAQRLTRGRKRRAEAPGGKRVVLGQPTPQYIRVMLAVSGVLVLALPVYVLLPQSEAVRQVFYDVVAVTALILGFLGLWNHHPPRRRAWLLTLLGYSMWVGGDIVSSFDQYLLPNRFPAPSDIFYLTAYPILGAGALMFVRTRQGGKDKAALLDASIVTSGAAVVIAVFVIAPITRDSSLSLAGVLVSSAYPLGDLFLLGVIARMYVAPGPRTASFRLLAASLSCTLLTDASYNVYISVTGESQSPTWMDPGWLLGYILIGAAACVPSMKMLAERATDRPERVPSARRLVALACGLVLPGLTLLLDGVTEAGVCWPVIGIGSVLLSVLVLVRMVGLLKIVQVQAVRLAALARCDSLTGAPNRRSWDHELSRACQTSKNNQSTLSVAILDLDRFKSYNDSHGHQAGDRLLREAVAAWTESLPPGTLLARYGGEEFTVLFPGFSDQEAAAALQLLRSVTPQAQTFSAGVATWDPATDPTAAITAADKALYVAKRSGRDRTVLHTQESGTSADRALPAFTVSTQPIIDLETLLIVGHEVMPCFSSTDVPTDDDEDLLELAIIQAGLAIRGRPADQDLYVNTSARALNRARFLEGLPTALDGIVIQLHQEPEGLELATMAEVVARLRARGARIALDNVGAGTQELRWLAVLRPDIIKIHRSLIVGCAEDAGCDAVLSALVTYAERLTLTLCAKGIERTADLCRVRDLGITLGQADLLIPAHDSWHGSRNTSSWPA